MATKKVNVYGNSIDLASAKDVLGDKSCYNYVNTEKMSSSELSKVIKSTDVIVGGTAAGVKGDVSTNGATRLGGWDRYETKDIIQKWEDDGCATCKSSSSSKHKSRNSTTSYPPAPQHIYKDFDKFTYFFGIDKLQVKHMVANNTCCLISPEIYIGQLEQDEYIQLEADCITSDVNSIEFYIVDGAHEVPVLPIDDMTVSNEKIFYGMNTRFSIDYDEPIEIKKDNVLITTSIESAIQSNDALYTVSYMPIDPYNYKPINSSIKIKVIQRLYQENTDAPYVAKMRIRRYGGDALWR